MNNAVIMMRDDETVSNIMKLRFTPFVANKAKGAVITDMEGNDFLDFSGAWGVMNVGYSHPRIIDIVGRQMNKLQFVPSISVYNNEMLELAEKLIDMIPGDFEKKVWFGHSGSDANEFIAKMVPVATGRSKMITFVGSYHGQTLGAYGMSGHPALGAFSAGGSVVKVPYPYCFRCPFEQKANSCDFLCAEYIANYVLKTMVSPDQVGAIVIEAIQCDGGDIVPANGFLKVIERICRKYGILLIIDEVKIGFGRTGSMFGFEIEGITPDAVVLGKALGCGQPLSAVVGTRKLMDSGLGMHLFTTAGNPLACAVSLENISIIEDEGLCLKTEQNGHYFLKELNRLKEKYDVIGDVRGRGLVIGMEMITDGVTKAPSSEIASLMVYRCYELGLVIYNVGVFSNVLEFTPPLIITTEQIDSAVTILEQSLDDVKEGKVDKEAAAVFAGWAV